MDVLVLGGTAFFGRAVVEQLLSRGDTVTIFSRGTVRPDWWSTVEHVAGDRYDPESLGRLRGRSFDAVIDNIAYTDRDVDMLLDVVSPTIGQYVLTSSAAVYYTNSGLPPYAEDDVDFTFRPPAGQEDAPKWRYTMGKIAAERTLRDRSDTVWTVIRPPIVLGPHDPTLRGWYYIQRLLDGGPILVPCCGERSFRLVYSHDLASAYLAVLDTPAARERSYNITQQEIVRLEDFLVAAAAGLGVEARTAEVSREQMREADVVGPYDRMSSFIPSVCRAVEELGYRSMPFTAWVVETARWYRDEYQGPDSAGYERRATELAIAGV
jgi:2'-hydroxyisoflavone reductase